MSGAASNFITKAFSATFYKQQWKNFLVSSYNYYHPMMRAGSATPLWHMMAGVAAVMYTTSYMARDFKRIQHIHAVEREAVKEYYEKRGIAPDHH